MKNIFKWLSNLFKSETEVERVVKEVMVDMPSKLETERALAWKRKHSK